MLTTSTGMLVKSIPEKTTTVADDDSRTTAASPTDEDLEELDGSEDWSVDRFKTDEFSAWHGYPVDENSYSMPHNFHHSVDGMDHFLSTGNGMDRYQEPVAMNAGAFDRSPSEYVSPR